MNRQQDGSVLYAVYGTLRPGFGNNVLFRNEHSEHLGTIQTPPIFTMYSLGGFPGVAETGDTAITIDVYRVTDDSVVRMVNGLEGYTGKRNDPMNWYDTCDVETPWGVANMFTMNGLRDGSRHSIVESGDWKNR